MDKFIVRNFFHFFISILKYFKISLQTFLVVALMACFLTYAAAQDTPAKEEITGRQIGYGFPYIYGYPYGYYHHGLPYPYGPVFYG